MESESKLEVEEGLENSDVDRDSQAVETCQKSTTGNDTELSNGLHPIHNSIEDSAVGIDVGPVIKIEPDGKYPIIGSLERNTASTPLSEIRIKVEPDSSDESEKNDKDERDADYAIKLEEVPGSSSKAGPPETGEVPDCAPLAKIQKSVQSSQNNSKIKTKPVPSSEKSPETESAGNGTNSVSDTPNGASNRNKTTIKVEADPLCSESPSRAKESTVSSVSERQPYLPGQIKTEAKDKSESIGVAPPKTEASASVHKRVYQTADEKAVVKAKERIKRMARIADEWRMDETIADPYAEFENLRRSKKCNYSLQEIMSISERIPERFGVEHRLNFIRACYVFGKDPNSWRWEFYDLIPPLHPVPHPKCMYALDELRSMTKGVIKGEKRGNFMILTYHRGQCAPKLLKTISKEKCPSWCRVVTGKHSRHDRYTTLDKAFPHPNCKHMLKELKCLAEQIPESFGLETRMKFISRCYKKGTDPTTEDWTKYTSDPYYEITESTPHPDCKHSIDELKRKAELIPESFPLEVRRKFFFQCYRLGHNPDHEDWTKYGIKPSDKFILSNPFNMRYGTLEISHSALSDLQSHPPHSKCKYTFEEIKDLAVQIPKSFGSETRIHFIRRCYRFGHDPLDENWTKYFEPAPLYPPMNVDNPYAEFDDVALGKSSNLSLDEIKRLAEQIPECFGVAMRVKFIRRCYNLGMDPATEDWTQYNINPYFEIKEQIKSRRCKYSYEDLMEMAMQIPESVGFATRWRFLRRCYIHGCNPLSQDWRSYKFDQSVQPDGPKSSATSSDPLNIFRNPYAEFEKISPHLKCKHSLEEVKEMAKRVPESLGIDYRIHFVRRCYRFGHDPVAEDWTKYFEPALLCPPVDVDDPFAEFDDMAPGKCCSQSLDEIKRFSEQIPQRFGIAMRVKFIRRCFRGGKNPATEDWTMYNIDPYSEIKERRKNLRCKHSYEDLKNLALQIPESMGFATRFRFLRRCYLQGRDPFSEFDQSVQPNGPMQTTNTSNDPQNSINTTDDVGPPYKKRIRSSAKKSHLKKPEKSFEVTMSLAESKIPKLSRTEAQVHVDNRKLSRGSISGKEGVDDFRRWVRNFSAYLRNKRPHHSCKLRIEEVNRMALSLCHKKRARNFLYQTYVKDKDPNVLLKSFNSSFEADHAWNGSPYKENSTLISAGDLPVNIRSTPPPVISMPCDSQVNLPNFKSGQTNVGLPTITPSAVENRPSTPPLNVSYLASNLTNSSSFPELLQSVRHPNVCFPGRKPGEKARPNAVGSSGSYPVVGISPTHVSGDPWTSSGGLFSPSVPPPTVDGVSQYYAATSTCLPPPILTQVNTPLPHPTKPPPPPSNHQPPSPFPQPQNPLYPSNDTAAPSCSNQTDSYKPSPPKKPLGSKPPKVDNRRSEDTIVPLYLAPSGYPNVRLSDGQMDVIENDILEAILDIDDGCKKPTFTESFRCNGQYGFLCCDDFTRKWIYTFFRTYQPWPNVLLTVMSNDSSKVRANAILPWCKEGEEIILKFIGKQNAGFDVSKWEIVQRWDTSDSQTCLHLMVDEESAKKLESCNSINFKLGSAKIIVARKERNSNESGNPCTALDNLGNNMYSNDNGKNDVLLGISHDSRQESGRRQAIDESRPQHYDQFSRSIGSGLGNPTQSSHRSSLYYREYGKTTCSDDEQQWRKQDHSSRGNSPSSSSSRLGWSESSKSRISDKLKRSSGYERSSSKRCKYYDGNLTPSPDSYRSEGALSPSPPLSSNPHKPGPSSCSPSVAPGRSLQDIATERYRKWVAAGLPADKALKFVHAYFGSQLNRQSRLTFDRQSDSSGTDAPKSRSVEKTFMEWQKKMK